MTSDTIRNTGYLLMVKLNSLSYRCLNLWGIPNSGKKRIWLLREIR